MSRSWPLFIEGVGRMVVVVMSAGHVEDNPVEVG